MAEDDNSTSKIQPNEKIAKERAAYAKAELKRILVVRGVEEKAAAEAADEIVASGFCIIGGGVPI